MAAVRVGSDSAATRSARPTPGWLLACALPVLIIGVAAVLRRWVVDDAFIYYRVVDNLQHGLGPVFNGGERVEAYTSPLWLLVLFLGDSVLPFVGVERLSVGIGLLCTLGGLLLAGRGARLLWDERARDGLPLPLGLGVLAALPPMWDYATSGLETGLVFLWLGAGFRVLVGLSRGAPGRRAQCLAAALVGLGPLVRPDLAIFTLGFLGALLYAGRVRGVRRILLVLACGLALPVAYQVFRMGYFAAVTANTALAKEAGLSYWGRGLKYFRDLWGTYWLGVPFALLAVCAIASARRGGRPPRAAVVVTGVTVACGALQNLFVMRVGGDYMHGRLLLPGVFAMLLPVAVVWPGRRAIGLGTAAVAVGWMIVCGAFLRQPKVPLGPFFDIRGFEIGYAKNPHPITLEDFRRAGAVRAGEELRRLARSGGHDLILRIPALDGYPFAVAGRSRGTEQPVVAAAMTVGLLGYAAGPDVYVADALGLGDPLAARSRIRPITFPPGTADRHKTVRVPYRSAPGHEKYLPNEWVVARFGPVGARASDYPGLQLSQPGIDAARKALRCPQLTGLLRAVDAPLDLHRFVANVGDSLRLTKLRFDAEPAAAAQELCR